MAFVPENLFTNANNADGASQVAVVIDVLERAFKAVLDFLFSIVSTLLDFFTRPDILGALVAIGLIYAWYKWLRKKRLG